MSKQYDYLEKVYMQNEGITFNMMCLYAMSWGFDKCRTLTDEEIQKSPKPSLFEDDYYRKLLMLTRELTNNISEYDLLKFAMVKPFLRFEDFHDVVNREKLEQMVKNGIDNELVSKMDIHDVKHFCVNLECDAEDLEKLGYEIPERYWEEEWYR